MRSTGPHIIFDGSLNQWVQAVVDLLAWGVSENWCEDSGSNPSFYTYTKMAVNQEPGVRWDRFQVHMKNPAIFDPTWSGGNS